MFLPIAAANVAIALNTAAITPKACLLIRSPPSVRQCRMDQWRVRTTLPFSRFARYFRMVESVPTPPPATAIPIAVVMVLTLPNVAISPGAARPSKATPAGAPAPPVPTVAITPATATVSEPNAITQATGPIASIARTASPREPLMMMRFSPRSIALPSSDYVLTVILIKSTSFPE